MEIASKSQAENGTDNNTIMTPLRVKQSISANAGGGGGSSVQSDWNEADASSDAYIKNKPTNLAVTNQNNNFSTPQTVTSSVDVATSAFGFYKIGGVPIVQYNANNHKTVLYGAPYDEGVTNGAIYIRPDAVHGYGDVVVTPASTSVDKNLIVKGDTYEWGSHYIGNGNDLTLAPQGPTDTPPTNDAGDIVFNQWRDEGGGAYYEIEKARIWTDNALSNSNYLPNYRAYDSSGNMIKQCKLLGNMPIEVTNENILQLDPGFYFKEGSTGWTENGWADVFWHATLIVSGTAYDANNGYRVLEIITPDNRVYRKTQSWNTWSDWVVVTNNYSTDELPIGTWINGKTLYRKVVQIPTFGATDTNVQTGITGADFVMMKGYFTRPGYNNLVYSIDNTYMSEYRFYRDTGIVQLATNNVNVEFTGYIVFEYTKTIS